AGVADDAEPGNVMHGHIGRDMATAAYSPHDRVSLGCMRGRPPCTTTCYRSRVADPGATG
ncbi:MAG TPA: hypothetical protein VF855_10415, partial [Acidimicrobiales bacterium]